MAKELKEKFFLVTYGIILFVLLMNYEWIFVIIEKSFKILTPFIIGIFIAYVLNIIVVMLEKGLLKNVKKNKRLFSLMLSLFIVFGFIGLILLILIPQVKNAGKIFINNIPSYQENVYEIGEKIGLSKKNLKFFDLDNNKVASEITGLISKNSKSIIGFSMGFASSIVNAICNIFIGFVFAVYILVDKENLKKKFKKLFEILFGKNQYEKLYNFWTLTNTTFTNFLKVQVLEAFILASLCFLGMIILVMPYAATISVVVCVTALIPVFGALIGCLIGAFLIFMISPIKAVSFIIFFLILQQFENNIIYPRVVGNKIGLPSMWVLVAVTIGGSLYGVLGMLLGVPVASIVYSLLRVFVNRKNSIKE